MNIIKLNQIKRQTIRSMGNDDEIALCGCCKSENIERQHRYSAEKIQLSTMYIQLGEMFYECNS